MEGLAGVEVEGGAAVSALETLLELAMGGLRPEALAVSLERVSELAIGSLAGALVALNIALGLAIDELASVESLKELSI